MFEGDCNMVSLKIKWVANTASLLIENKGSISLYSKEVKGGRGGGGVENHPIIHATCRDIENFLHVRIFLQINGHSLIIFKIFHIYKRKNLVHFFNPTSFGRFYSFFAKGLTPSSPLPSTLF